MITAILGIVLVSAAAYCVWSALTTARTPQGAVAWTIFLVAAPWAAVPAFFVFGQHKMRTDRLSYRRTLAATESIGLPGAAADCPPKAAERLGIFSTLGGLPVVPGNATEILVDGTATFDAIFAAIDGAETYVLAQFYTIEDDALGTAFADRLIAAAARGVRVMLLCDRVGSYGLPSSYRHRLVQAGVEFPDPHAGVHRTSRSRINFRNHRKTVVVDGRWATLGGHNVADTYLGLDPELGHWRDTHLALRGPVVAQLQLGFVQDWHWHTGTFLYDALDWTAGPVPGGVDAVTVPMGPTDLHDTGALFFFAAITRARRRVWIASPYVVPDVDTLSALKCAALAGCDVCILMPARIDHYLPWLAAFAYFDEMRAAGVRIFRYEDGFMHQKVVLVDDDLAAIGTANLDNRSFRLNFETMVTIADEGFASEVAEMLRADMAHATLLDRRLEEQRLSMRVGARLARLLAPVL
ncbi:cardiolipin synthase [Roseivivax isoporae LMG 25204]|uniref:Cardiolipin synthase n=1 Tax=Roseivivax isoporae LMG 25204 TaxID=1449351 RepID=X7F5C5_9RHOB|nr:cardiolipin synthase [Roseivivax isoporae LMG 25204]